MLPRKGDVINEWGDMKGFLKLQWLKIIYANNLQTLKNILHI